MDETQDRTEALRLKLARSRDSRRREPGELRVLTPKPATQLEKGATRHGYRGPFLMSAEPLTETTIYK
jgi:hypothetical protein